MLGRIKEDRRRKINGVIVAGMLIFGECLYIRDLIAKINFDFMEEIDVSSDQRWSDRFIIDGTLENNIYNFNFTVINKLTSNVKEPFRLENLERKDDT